MPDPRDRNGDPAFFVNSDFAACVLTILRSDFPGSDKTPAFVLQNMRTRLIDRLGKTVCGGVFAPLSGKGENCLFTK